MIIIERERERERKSCVKGLLLCRRNHVKTCVKEYEESMYVVRELCKWDGERWLCGDRFSESILQIKEQRKLPPENVCFLLFPSKRKLTLR